MFSKIVFIVFVNFIFCGSGMDSELLGLDPVVKCYKAAEDVAYAHIEAMGEHPIKDADKMKFTCLSLKGYGSCLVGIIKASSPVPKVFYFFALIEYQHEVLLTKAGLCPNMLNDELKKITMESDIMKKENLVNIEDDDYAECAGDALKKYMMEGFTMFEHHVEMATENNKYLECMEGEAKAYTAPIMKHFIGQLKAYERPAKEMLGKLGEE